MQQHSCRDTDPVLGKIGDGRGMNIFSEAAHTLLAADAGGSRNVSQLQRIFIVIVNVLDHFFDALVIGAFFMGRAVVERQGFLKEQQPKPGEGFPDGKFIPERMLAVECNDLMIEREHCHVRLCVCGKAAGSDGSISKDRQQIVLFDLTVVHSCQKRGMEQMGVETAGSCPGSRT